MIKEELPRRMGEVVYKRVAWYNLLTMGKNEWVFWELMVSSVSLLVLFCFSFYNFKEVGRAYQTMLCHAWPWLTWISSEMCTVETYLDRFLHLTLSLRHANVLKAGSSKHPHTPGMMLWHSVPQGKPSVDQKLDQELESNLSLQGENHPKTAIPECSLRGWTSEIFRWPLLGPGS